jgi:hypothetical protein
MFPSVINSAEMNLLEDEFNFLDTVKWSDVNDGATGTNTADDVAGGQVSVVSAAAANDYHFYVSKCKPFLLAAKKPLWFTARFKAGSSAGMQYLGVTSVLTSSISTDTTGVLSTNFSGGMFFCLPGSLALGFTTSNGTTQTVTASLLTLVAGQLYTVGFHWDSNDGTTSLVKPWVIDETAGKLYQGNPQPVAIASLAQKGVLFGVKSAGAAETFSLDYVRCAQKR